MYQFLTEYEKQRLHFYDINSVIFYKNDRFMVSAGYSTNIEIISFIVSTPLEEINKIVDEIKIIKDRYARLPEPDPLDKNDLRKPRSFVQKAYHSLYWKASDEAKEWGFIKREGYNAYANKAITYHDFFYKIARNHVPVLAYKLTNFRYMLQGVFNPELSIGLIINLDTKSLDIFLKGKYITIPFHLIPKEWNMLGYSWRDKRDNYPEKDWYEILMNKYPDQIFIKENHKYHAVGLTEN